MARGTVVVRVDLVECLLPLAKQPLRVALEEGSLRGRRHAAARAGQLLHAERSLEGADPPAQGRLCEAALLGGAEDAAVVEDGEEVFEFTQLHASGDTSNA